MFDEILKYGFEGQNVIIGLGEHFRNLLVVKDIKTFSLLEVSEDMFNRYKNQAEDIDKKLIIKAIELLNNSEYKYRTMSNKRLHFELTLMQLYSLFVSKEEDRKTDTIIVNKKEEQSELKLQGKKELNVSQKEELSVNKKELNTDKPEKKEETKDNGRKNIVGLNQLIESKNKIKESISEKEVNFSEINEKSYDEPIEINRLLDVWGEFVEIKKEDVLLNAILSKNKPEIVGDSEIVYFVSSEIEKSSLLKIKSEFISFLKERLKNKNITIEITVKESDNKESYKPYSESEKYEYLKMKNPNFDSFCKILNLRTIY